jgi:hypothetical protein
MRGTRWSPADRRETAKIAINILDGHLSDHRRLDVRCGT